MINLLKRRQWLNLPPVISRINKCFLFHTSLLSLGTWRRTGTRMRKETAMSTTLYSHTFYQTKLSRDVTANITPQQTVQVKQPNRGSGIYESNGSYLSIENDCKSNTNSSSWKCCTIFYENLFIYLYSIEFDILFLYFCFLRLANTPSM